MARFGGGLIAGVLALGGWALPAAASVQYSTLKPLDGVWARDCQAEGAAFDGFLIGWKEDERVWLIGSSMTDTLENAYSDTMDTVGDVEITRSRKVTGYTLYYQTFDELTEDIPYEKGKNTLYIYQIDPKNIHISQVPKKLTDPSIFKSVHTLCQRWD